MNKLRGLIWGGIVGDALGVPVEFKDRLYCQQNPITDMIGYGTHNQPTGTWSDNTSLTLCLIDQMNSDKTVDNFNITQLHEKMLLWLNNSKYTAHDYVFDCEITVYDSLMYGPLESNKYNKNGNGALMRIAPVVVLFEHNSIYWKTVANIIELTHKHYLNYLMCKTYLNILHEILNSEYTLKPDLSSIDEVSSSGFVVSTLNSALWCFNTTSTYEECVLKAVNLGGDAGNVASITGQLAGAYYGYDNIPKKWIDQIQNKNLLESYIIPYIQFYN